MLNVARNIEKMCIQESILNSDSRNQRSQQKTLWFPGIQELRGLLIALIIISHAADFPVVGSKSIWGAAGVTGFFMIAGFLTPERLKTTDSYSAYVRCGIENVTRTVKKIYFPYLVCLLASVFVNPGTVMDFFKCLLLSQSYWGSISTATSFNGNTWFLSSILLSYFLAPILSKIITGKKLCCSVILLLGLFVFQFLYGMLWNNWNFESGYYWFYIFPAYRIVDFAEGIVIRNIFNQRHKLFDVLEGPIFIVSISLFVIELLIIERIARPLQYDAAWAPVIAVMLMCYALQEHFRLYPLGKLGGMSMELFLSHRLVMLVILRHGNDVIHFIVFAICSLNVAFLLKMVKRKMGDINDSRRRKAM